MTREEARKRAEQFVYCDCNLGDIVNRCEIAGIKTHNSKGRLISRSMLEQKLIEHYTEIYAEE